MKVSRRVVAASLSLVFCSAFVRAQDAAPISDTQAPQIAPVKPPKAKARAPEGPFLVKPYLQPGHTVAAGKVVLMWHAADSDAPWTVETRPAADRPWQTAAKAPSASRIAVPGIEPHRVYHLALTGLEPGKKFGYRISQANKVVFEAEGRAAAVGRPEAAVRRVRRLRSRARRNRRRSPTGRSSRSPIT